MSPIKQRKKRGKQLCVILVEQNPLALPGLVALIGQANIQTRVDNELNTCSVDLAKGSPIVVVDIGTLVVPLHSCLQHFRSQCPNARILFLSNDLSEQQMLLLLGEGIHGFVPYKAVRKQLTRAISKVANGKVNFPPEVMEEFAKSGKALHARWSGVTERERDVLKLLEQGLSNKQAAIVLRVSENTIKFHVTNIFRKLAVHDRRSAVAISISGRLHRIDTATSHLGPRRPPTQFRSDSQISQIRPA
jgi:DNA-binding NarL/FixJ family response regulator